MVSPIDVFEVFGFLELSLVASHCRYMGYTKCHSLSSVGEMSGRS